MTPLLCKHVCCVVISVCGTLLRTHTCVLPPLSTLILSLPPLTPPPSRLPISLVSPLTAWVWNLPYCQRHPRPRPSYALPAAAAHRTYYPRRPFRLRWWIGHLAARHRRVVIWKGKLCQPTCNGSLLFFGVVSCLLRRTRYFHTWRALAAPLCHNLLWRLTISACCTLCLLFHIQQHRMPI